MGQEQSAPSVGKNTPPRTLKARTVDGVAQLIKEGRAKKVVVMTGAGISTSAGIPDFRSPDTGLYANLQRLNLPFAEAVFDISYFRNNPLPFYTLAQELFPGKYRPTITHSFINLLHQKGLLMKLFTQNIDCLEREAGVPDDKIIEAHGSFARQSCIECRKPYPRDLMEKAIREKSVPRCLEDGCGGLVKPEIVFFGEQLPSEFFANRHLPEEADLCIVMGTSLSVQPFASLPGFCTDSTPRVLINQEQVGGIGLRPDDVLVLGDCDEGVRKLAGALGWLDELEALWAKTAPGRQPKTEKERLKKSRDEQLQEEVEKMTKEVEENLKISEGHKSWLEQHVVEKAAKASESEPAVPVPSTAQADLQEPAAPEPAISQPTVPEPAAPEPAIPEQAAEELDATEQAPTELVSTASTAGTSTPPDPSTIEVETPISEPITETTPTESDSAAVAEDSITKQPESEEPTPAQPTSAEPTAEANTAPAELPTETIAPTAAPEQQRPEQGDLGLSHVFPFLSTASQQSSVQTSQQKTQQKAHQDELGLSHVFPWAKKSSL
ncbi:SIR2-domain-containing protein [Sporormia fimetaria CBS 119925]|uniref:SIR2-domain-containing protein n=1 Tax=Sporormia fimetaria CBS 119925 TaxID=1340428 RepID=A0A6A6V903_9PLEO|nr:SIR2-domain-containing protein [Sporormia fimetaria CBS 119925]